MYNVYALCNGILQCFGARAGAARSRSFMLEPEPKKKIRFRHRLRQLSKNTFITSIFFQIMYDNEFSFFSVIVLSTKGFFSFLIKKIVTMNVSFIAFGN